MVERGLGQQGRYLQRNPLVRQHYFPLGRRRRYYNSGHRIMPLRNHLMFGQSEDFIDRTIENSKNFYFTRRRVPYYSGKYFPRDGQIIAKRKRRMNYLFSRLPSRHHYDHHHNPRPPSSSYYWQDDYQLRDYFYYG